MKLYTIAQFFRGKTSGELAAWILCTAEAEKKFENFWKENELCFACREQYCSYCKGLKSSVYHCLDVPSVCFTVIKVETDKAMLNPKRNLRRFQEALAIFYVCHTVTLAEWPRLTA